MFNYCEKYMHNEWIIRTIKCYHVLNVYNLNHKVMYMHDEYVIILSFIIFLMLIILIYALNGFWKCSGSQMVLELIKNSRRAKFVQRGNHEVANRRLSTAQTREQAASRLVTGWAIFFVLLLVRLLIFLHMFLFFHQNREYPLHFHSIFLRFSPIFMPKSIIQTNTHVLNLH